MSDLKIKDHNLFNEYLADWYSKILTFFLY